MFGKRTYGGEKILYRSYPRMFRDQPLRFMLYLLLAPIGVGLYFLIRWWIKNYDTRLTLTDSLVIFERGILNTKTTEVRMVDIRSVEIDRTFIERILGTGTIRISSAASDGYEIEITAMPNPRKIRRTIDERRRTGSSTE